MVIPTIDYVLKLKTSRYMCLGTSIIAIGLSSVLILLTRNQEPTILYDQAIMIDPYGAFIFLIISLGVFLVTLASFNQTKDWTTSPSFFSLLLVIAIGVYYVVSANDLVVFLAAWSLVSVAAYALVAIKKDTNALEGAGKYALMGVTASTFILFGIAILIGLTNITTDLNTIAEIAISTNLPLTLIAIIMFVVGIGFKIGIVPFHGWLPDVYGNVNPITISFVATILKVSGVIAILRLIYPFAIHLGDRWLMLFAVLSVVNMTFGNLAALVQRKVQRMMAFSSIAHVGYMLVGFAAATSEIGADFGVQGIALHLVSYVLATLGIFVALAYLNKKGVNTNLEGICGLWKKMPILSITILILLLSLIGVPPLVGFWSKFVYLFISTIEVAPWLTLIAIINTGISVGYYGQIIKYIFLTQPQEEKTQVKENIRDPEIIVMLITTALTIILGLGIVSFIAPLLVL